MRDIHFAKLFKGYKIQDFLDRKDLIILMQEISESSDSNQQILEMSIDDFRVKSENVKQGLFKYKLKFEAFLPLNICPSVATFVDQVTKNIKKFRKKVELPINFFPHKHFFEVIDIITNTLHNIA